MKVVIDFARTDEIRAGLVLVRPSGVVFSNQAGGRACTHPEAEGVYVPLYGLDLSEEPEAAAVQDRTGFDAAHAAAVLALCERLGVPFRPATDPAGLAVSQEAWVWGRVHNPDRRHHLIPPECHGMEAVLVWDNSD